MVNAVGTRETAQRIAQRLAGGGSLVDWEDYSSLRPRRWAPGSAVAVIYIDSDLVDGNSWRYPWSAFVSLVTGRSSAPSKPPRASPAWERSSFA